MPAPALFIPTPGSLQTAALNELEYDDLHLNEALLEGQKAYRRSCVACHGVTPEDLAHNDQQHFIETVRNGYQAMPALGYKLNAVEAEIIRIYVSHCNADPSSC